MLFGDPSWHALPYWEGKAGLLRHFLFPICFALCHFPNLHVCLLRALHNGGDGFTLPCAPAVSVSLHVTFQSVFLVRLSC